VKPRRAPEGPGLSPEKARALALRRLGARECSRLELEAYLRRKGVGQEEARALVGELEGRGWLSDERYARSFAREQALREQGPWSVARKLRAKGVSLEIAEARELCRITSGSDEKDRIEALLEKRYPRSGENPREARRALEGLIRRGFSRELVLDALRARLRKGVRAFEPEGLE
jgi:regulatory protein